MVKIVYVENELRKAPFLLTSCLRTLLIFAWQLVSTEQYRAIVAVIKTVGNGAGKEKSNEAVNKMKQIAGPEIWELAVRLASLMGNPKWVSSGTRRHRGLKTRGLGARGLKTRGLGALSTARRISCSRGCSTLCERH